MLEDYNQLLELTNELYQQILLQYQKKGGSEDMKPLLPGALELPNDKYRFRIDELETKVASLTSENTSLTNENASLTNENASLTDKVQTLEQTVAELQRKLNEGITSN
ncbi:MAG: bZIP transcription factor [Clostridiales bacterium]|nr:bZIP transcription factor [Clostridiales bacterium]